MASSSLWSFVKTFAGSFFPLSYSSRSVRYRAMLDRVISRSLAAAPSSFPAVAVIRTAVSPWTVKNRMAPRFFPLCSRSGWILKARSKRPSVKSAWVTVFWESSMKSPSAFTSIYT